jgi:predicted ester cyclase
MVFPRNHIHHERHVHGGFQRVAVELAVALGSVTIARTEEIAPTGRVIQYAGAAVFKFKGDLIVEVWILGDVYGLISQLSAKMNHYYPIYI